MSLGRGPVAGRKLVVSVNGLDGLSAEALYETFSPRGNTARKESPWRTPKQSFGRLLKVADCIGLPKARSRYLPYGYPSISHSGGVNIGVSTFSLPSLAWVVTSTTDSSRFASFFEMNAKSEIYATQ